jgi:hypothetical protein
MISLAAAAAISLAATAPAHSAVVYDESPSGNFFSIWGNSSEGNNWLMQFTLASAATITGVDIWTDSHVLLVNDGVVKLRSDSAGSPAATNDIARIDDVALSHASDPTYTNLYRVHGEFTGVHLAAGTYWIGLSGGDGVFGPSAELGIASFLGGDHSGQKHFAGDTADTLATGSTLAFQVEGSTAPEPATWALMLAGFGLVGAAARRLRPAPVRAG